MGVEPLPEHAGIHLQEDVKKLLARVREAAEDLGPVVVADKRYRDDECVRMAPAQRQRRRDDKLPPARTCVGYARARKQFGQAIGKFQDVAGKVADMYLRLQAARLLVYQAAWLAQQGKPALAEVAAAKLFTSEA